MNKRRKAIILLLVLIIAGGIYYRWSQPVATTNQLRVSGNIEVTEVGLGFKIAGLVAKRLVEEGETVRQGQVVAELEKAELELAVMEAEAALQQASLQLLELKNGSRPQEVLAAQAAQNRAAADLENATAEYRRAEQLFAMNAISAQERERAATALAVARARYEEATQALNLVVEGPRPEQLALAEARVRQASEQLKLAQTRLAYAQLSAPSGGVVLSVNLEPGEYAAAGVPIITIGNLENVYLKAFINETDLGRVKLGQKVCVTTDTYPDKVYHGRVSFIASEAEFTPKNIQTSAERVKLVYRIKIDIPNPDQELKPGMPADAIILHAEDE